MRIHHVQVACPAGGEGDARRFYVTGLGMVEVEKPPRLRARGGVWFRSHDEAGAVTAELHVGVEEPFVPARKAHPAFVLASVAALEAVAVRIEAVGGVVDRRQRHDLPALERLHAFDLHGNRVELLAPA